MKEGEKMYNITTLKNGVRIVAEHIPYVRSVSLGIWVYTGSRNEKKENNGISHFIEHMLFKGTENRTAKEIAENIDNIGGQLNAFTAKEYTCYYTKTLDTHLDIGIDVLSDMFFNSKINQRDIDIERKVILEEINMYEDSPEELVHDILLQAVWGDNALGYPILGNKESLNTINRESIMHYMQNHYTPKNTVIAIVGNFNECEVLTMLKEKFENWDSPHNIESNYTETNFNSRILCRNKDTEQNHICIGFKGIEQGEISLYDLLVVNSVFGGGMSSRLFQKIREEKGLAYSVYSYPSSYKRNGLFTIYAAMNPLQMKEVVKLICEEIQLLKKHKIIEDEVIKAKEQLKGNYILALESTSSRMNNMGKSELLLRKIKTQDEILNQISAITVDSVARIIENIFVEDKFSAAIVGKRVEEEDIKKLIHF